MIPSSSSSCWIVFLPRRAASRAASLTRFARSAPVKPGVAAAEARATMAADGVDLVHEHDAGRRLLRLLEEVAHARGADADEHLDEIRSRDREERDARLTGDGTREQRLTGTRRAVEQDAL